MKIYYYTTAFGGVFRIQMDVFCIWADKNNNKHDYFSTRFLLEDSQKILQIWRRDYVETPWGFGEAPQDVNVAKTYVNLAVPL